MPVDYSKWDALELSDDSDIEVHPNVDKRSFIRAKQNQIHQERQYRRQQIATLQYERQINDGLEGRIAGLLAALRAHADEARTSSDPNAAGAVAFRAVMESAAKLKPEEDRPPPVPAGVHTDAPPPESYTKMMAALLDQVNTALADRSLEGAARYDAMVAEIEGHQHKVADLQQQLVAKLSELEYEETRKITSDNFHTGFDSSHVNKSASSSGDAKVELLNPQRAGAEGGTSKSKGKAVDTGGGGGGGGDHGDDAGNEADDDDDDEMGSASEVAREFGNIRPGQWGESEACIRAHPELVASDKEMDGILMMAFDAEFEGRPEAAQRFVHQATLLEFCRALGRDGVALFFRRIGTPGHQAHEVLRRDVAEKYQRIHARVQEINAQRAASAGGGADGIEQIQLHAVEPGTAIHIRIPPAGAAAEVGEEAAAARLVFEGFAPEMRAALESGNLDRVNEVLGRMPVPAAEALVGEFSEAGILSMEDEIIDATTEEGRQQLKELGRDEEVEAEGEAPDKPAKVVEAVEEYPDPE